MPVPVSTPVLTPTGFFTSFWQLFFVKIQQMIEEAAVAAAVASDGWPLPSVPVGLVLPFSGSTIPVGWLLCYGQATSRSVYSALFAVIGTTYGAGDGSTTFNLPDLRGRQVIGLDNMGGTAASRVVAAIALGQAAGTETHTHAYSVLSGTPTITAPVTESGAGQVADHNHQHLVEGTTDSGISMDPYIALNYIIKC